MSSLPNGPTPRRSFRSFAKTPELVRKEVWAHVLAYSLLRTVMAQAARHDLKPRSVSFTGATDVSGL